ncbi:MAG: hypothetical protein WC966_12260 [Bradymonadales bacterium]
MTQKEQAWREDRARFLRATDHCQQSTKLTAEQKSDIEQLRQWFREAPDTAEFLKTAHPPILPEGCSNPHFASSWEAESQEEDE